MVQEVTYFMHEEYATNMFESCRDVQFGGSSVLNLMCGEYGVLCTPHRWLTHLGSTANGYAPFDIIYMLGNDNVDGFRRHNPYAAECHRSINVSAPYLLVCCK